MKSKRGSHVGFVISFVMFVTFVLFMYMILNLKVDFGQQKANSLEHVNAEILERVSGNLTTISVSIRDEDAGSCVRLNGFFQDIDISHNFVAVSDSGTVFNTGVSGNHLQVQRGSNDFFRIYESEDFPEVQNSLGSCDNLNEGAGGYVIGLVRSSNEVFESKITDLFTEYAGDYETLKREMKISPSDDFGFMFINNENIEVRTLERNVTVNVYVNSNAIQYVGTNGTIKSGFLNAMIW